MNRSFLLVGALAASVLFIAPAFATPASTDITIDTGASKVLQANLAGNIGSAIAIDQTNALNVVDLTGASMANATVDVSASKVVQANVGVGIDFTGSGVVKDTQTNAANVVSEVLSNVGTSSVDKVNATMDKVAQVNVGVNLPLAGGTSVANQVNAGNIVSVKIK